MSFPPRIQTQERKREFIFPPFSIDAHGSFLLPLTHLPTLPPLLLPSTSQHPPPSSCRSYALECLCNTSHRPYMHGPSNKESPRTPPLTPHPRRQKAIFAPEGCLNRQQFSKSVRRQEIIGGSQKDNRKWSSWPRSTGCNRIPARRRSHSSICNTRAFNGGRGWTVCGEEEVNIQTFSREE